MGKRQEIVAGQRYGKLTAVKEVDKTNPRLRRFLWQCDCGDQKEINLIQVTRGNSKSCGCELHKYMTNQPQFEDSPNWKGGRRVEYGYSLVYQPQHPNAKPNGYVREHRYVMSQHLGRPLERDENVHHINGNKLDNRLCNLELWNTSHPCGQRVEDKIAWAKEILERYKEWQK